MKVIKKSSQLFYILAFLFTGSALAGHTAGKITHIYSGPGFGTKLFIAVDNDIVAKGDCLTNSLYDFAIDTSTPGANTWVSMITLAYATGKEVWVSGSGLCTLHLNVEDLLYIRLNP